MPVFTNLDVEESATVTARVGTVQIARGSTNEEQEILCIGDPDSSNAIAAVTAAAPLSTRWGLNVRIVSGPSSAADLALNVSSLAGRALVDQNSTVWPVQVSSVAGRVDVGEYSTAAALTGSTGLIVRLASTGVRVINSSAADLLANVSSVAGRVLTDQNSTVWAVQVDGRVRAQNSTIGDLLASVQQNSTVWAVQADGRVRAQNSTIGDLLASVQQNSTVWQTQAAIRTSSGGGVEGSTTTPAAGTLGLHVRPVFPTLLSTTLNITSTNSSAFYTLIDAAGAGVKNKIYAYFVGSTHTIPSTGEFISSTSAPKFAVNFGSGSSGITGANLAVSPPAYLFETAANTSLTFRCAGNSSAAATTVLRVSISYFQEA